MADSYFVFQIKVAGVASSDGVAGGVGSSGVNKAKGIAEEVREAVYRKHSNLVVNSAVTIVDAFYDNAETSISES